MLRLRAPRAVLTLATLLLAAASLRAQSPAGTSPSATSPAAAATPAAPAANPRDVGTLDAILAALYDVISGPAGQPRDWARFRALMAPQARLIPTGRNAAGAAALRTLTVDEYVTTIGPRLERDGFFERELGRKVERYGDVVHVMSAYDSKRRLEDAAPFARGVNSIQLWFDGQRWWVVTIFWESETPERPIPADLLGGRP
jgi:hypothetical protein